MSPRLRETNPPRPVFKPEPATMRGYREIIGTIYDLSPYEERVLSALLAAKEPMGAYNIFNCVGVHRTKIYGVLKRLINYGLIEIHTVSEEEVQKPDIWGYWPDHKRTKFLAEYYVGVTRYTVKREVIEARLKETLEAAKSLSDTWTQLTGEAQP